MPKAIILLLHGLWTLSDADGQARIAYLRTIYRRRRRSVVVSGAYYACRMFESLLHFFA